MSKQAQIKLLHSLYYDLDQISALSSAYNLFKAARLQQPDIKLQFVRDWYNQQRAATLWRKAPKRFTKNPVIQTRPMYQVQADLCDMGYFTKWNYKYRYILVVIDVMTKKAFCRALKNKNVQQVLPALKEILDPLKTVHIFQSDLGTEFTNSKTKEYFRQRHIQVWLSQDRETKAQIAERFIQTLRSKIMRYMTGHDTKEWVGVLQKIVSNYNNTHHRSIGMPPNKVTLENLQLVRRKLYPPISKSQNHRRAIAAHREQRQDDLKAGDLVRISRIQEQFEKLTFRWTDELFRIWQVIKRRPRYIFKLVDLAGETIEGSFYRENLLKVPEIL